MGYHYLGRVWGIYNIGRVGIGNGKDFPDHTRPVAKTTHIGLLNLT